MGLSGPEREGAAVPVLLSRAARMALYTHVFRVAAIALCSAREKVDCTPPKAGTRGEKLRDSIRIECKTLPRLQHQGPRMPVNPVARVWMPPGQWLVTWRLLELLVVQHLEQVCVHSAEQLQDQPHRPRTGSRRGRAAALTHRPCCCGVGLSEEGDPGPRHLPLHDGLGFLGGCLGLLQGQVLMLCNREGAEREAWAPERRVNHEPSSPSSMPSPGSTPSCPMGSAKRPGDEGTAVSGSSRHSGESAVSTSIQSAPPPALPQRPLRRTGAPLGEAVAGKKPCRALSQKVPTTAIEGDPASLGAPML